MKKLACLIFSLIIFIGSITVGLIHIGESIANKSEYKKAERLYNETLALTGEIENRVVIRSGKTPPNTMGAIGIAGGYDNIRVYQYQSKKDAERALEYFSSLDYVDSAEYDVKMTPCANAFYDNDDAKCYATASSNIDDMIKLIKANYTSLNEVKVAVIDSGCEDNDLTATRVDKSEVYAGKDNSHGTKVCGTVIYNTLDNVKIYSYDVGDTNGFSGIACTTSLTMARTQGCKVVNMSFGSYEESTSLKTAINRCYNAGMILIAAAGNDGLVLTSDNQHYPSAYSNVIGIGALDVARKKASYSNYGEGINYFAIGTNVRTYQSGSEINWSGTSAATPIVTSIVANLLTADSSLTVNEIKNNIVTKFSHDDTVSYSYIDGYATLSAIIGKELPQVEFTYDLFKNDTTGYTSLTVHCDEDTRIYCKINSTSSLSTNNKTKANKSMTNGDTYNLGLATTVCVVAYADGKRKSDEKILSVSKQTGNGYTYTQTGGVLTYCELLDSKVIEVPSTFSSQTVKSIGAATFAGNPNVETIILPQSVTSVGEYAFANCPKLKSVIAPGVEKLGRYAFENCENLLFAYFPSVTAVNNCAMYSCPKLTAIDVGSLSDIGTLNETVFYNSDSIISKDKTTHLYDFSEILNKAATYTCKECQSAQTVTVTAELLSSMWSVYIVGRRIDTKEYDSMFLFDVNNDNVINAKDYAIINNNIEKA